jgi:uncharacterized protein YPO0396
MAHAAGYRVKPGEEVKAATLVALIHMLHRTISAGSIKQIETYIHQLMDAQPEDSDSIAPALLCYYNDILDQFEKAM